MNFTTKKRALSNLPTSSVSGKKTATCVLCHSTRSFGNEPLVPSIDLQNQENVIIVFQNMIKAKESEKKIFFWKEYYFFLDCTYYIFNFNKYFVRIIFLFCFVNFARPKFTKFVQPNS